MNKIEIRKALREYLEVKEWRKLIKQDEDIQAILDQIILTDEQKEKINSLIEQRYPLGTDKELREKSIDLVKAMIKNYPGYEKADPYEIYRDFGKFKQLIELAKKI